MSLISAAVHQLHWMQCWLEEVMHFQIEEEEEKDEIGEVGEKGGSGIETSSQASKLRTLVRNYDLPAH